MPITLIPETGTGTDMTANSYASLVQIRSYNLQRGVTLPDDDEELVAFATKALDYIEQYEPRWKGQRAQPLTQPLSWPRRNAILFESSNSGFGWRGGFVNGYENIGRSNVDMYPDNAIPVQLIYAHAYAAGVAANAVDLLPVMEGRAVINEVIGPLQTEYSVQAGAALKPLLPNLDAILAPLLAARGVVTSVRV